MPHYGAGSVVFISEIMPKAKSTKKAKATAPKKEIIFMKLPDRSCYFAGVKYELEADVADHYIKMGFAKTADK